MKAIILASFCLLLTLSYLQTQPSNPTSFESWSEKHGKFYSPIEKQYREYVYQQNLLLIQSHNSDPSQTYKMGENKFMDITQEEFQNLVINMNQEKYTQKSFSNSQRQNIKVPDAVDWRGYAKIRDQGNCKAGGPMCSVSAVDAYYAINYQQQIYTSAQQIIDCNGDESSCDNPKPFFMSLAQVASNGVTSDSKYPFVGKQQACKDPEGEYTVNNLIYLNEEDVDAMKEALVLSPVNIAVEASNWQFYSSGVFSSCGIKQNHYALAVGYDREGNWYVQNSFGSGWGEKGYITLAPGNTCGILEDGWQFL